MFKYNKLNVGLFIGLTIAAVCGGISRLPVNANEWLILSALWGSTFFLVFRRWSTKSLGL